MSSEPNAPMPDFPGPDQPPPLPPSSHATPQPGPPARKSPGLAVVLSFFPGLGHLYLGLYQRGISFFVAFAASILLADQAGLGILIPFVWFFALVDAYRQAQFISLGCGPEPYLGEEAKRATRKGNLKFGVFLVVIGLLLLYNNFYPIDLSFMADWWPMLFVLTGGYFILRHYIDRERARRAEVEQSERL